MVDGVPRHVADLRRETSEPENMLTGGVSEGEDESATEKGEVLDEDIHSPMKPKRIRSPPGWLTDYIMYDDEITEWCENDN